MNKLVLIKIVHTLVWIFFNLVMIYLFYAVISNNIGFWVWAGLALFGVEGIVLLVCNKMCPLTILARRYSDSSRANFDIYLPHWLAKYNKLIYSFLLAIVVIILVYRLTAK
jgi:hypothetical protein